MGKRSKSPARIVKPVGEVSEPDMRFTESVGLPRNLARKHLFVFIHFAAHSSKARCLMKVQETSAGARLLRRVVRSGRIQSAAFASKQKHSDIRNFLARVHVMIRYPKSLVVS